MKSYFERENETKECIEKFLPDFRKRYQSEKCQQFCPLECDSMSFSVAPYLEPYPSSGRIGKRIKS